MAVSVLDVEDGDQAPAVHLEAECVLSAALTPMYSEYELVCAAINCAELLSMAPVVPTL